MPSPDDKTIPVFGELSLQERREIDPSVGPIVGSRIVTERAFASGRPVEYAAGNGPQNVPAKFAIEVKVPDLQWNLDEFWIARDVGCVMATVISENMLSGKTPSGGPLPSVSQATIDRRRYREEFEERGRHAAARLKNSKKRLLAYRRHKRRFEGVKKYGFKADPRDYPRPWWGVESGLLAKSLVAGKNPSGGVSLYAVDRRGKPDRTGASGMSRVFTRVAPWSADATKQPRVQTVLKQAAAAIIQNRVAKGISVLLNVLKNAERVREDLDKSESVAAEGA